MEKAIRLSVFRHVMDTQIRIPISVLTSAYSVTTTSTKPRTQKCVQRVVSEIICTRSPKKVRISENVLQNVRLTKSIIFRPTSNAQIVVQTG